MQGCRVYYFFISFIFRVFFFFCVTSYISGECVKKNKNQITARAKKKKKNSNKQTQKQITQMLFYNFSNILHVHYSSAYYLSFIIFGFSIIENKTKKKKKKNVVVVVRAAGKWNSFLSLSFSSFFPLSIISHLHSLFLNIRFDEKKKKIVNQIHCTTYSLQSLQQPGVVLRLRLVL